MRILHIGAANSLTGGGEKHIADLMTTLGELGHEVGLAAPDGGDLKDIAESHNIAYFPVEIGSGFSFGRLADMRAILEKFNPDIVHAHGHRAALFARMADPQAAQRVVYTLHGIHVDSGTLAPLKMQNEKVLSEKTAYFIVTCQQDFDKAIDLGIVNPRKLGLVYNGLAEDLASAEKSGEFRDEIGLDHDTVLILHVGRLHYQKNHNMLIDALALAKPKISVPFRLVMVAPGEDKDREKLVKYIASKGLTDDTILLGGRSNLTSAYRDADIFVLSSRHEGTPYALLEAMMAGLPVVATAVGGIPEAIEQGKSGLLSPPDDAAALAESLATLSNNPEMRISFGALAQKTAQERYSLAAMTALLEDVYKKVLAES